MKKQEIEKEIETELKELGCKPTDSYDLNSLREFGKICFKEGSLSKEKEVLKILDELNKKYPSQCSGEIGIKWNEEFRKRLEQNDN